MARLTLNNLSKRCTDGTDAVQHISLDIADGEFVVLVGPFDCGNQPSTILRLIAGLAEVSGGEISLDDSPINPFGPQGP